MIAIEAGLLKAHTMLSHIENGAPRAISNALNRTIDGVKTDVVREVVAQYDIKPGAVRKIITVKKSYPTYLTASIGSAGSPIPLIQFSVNPSKPTKVKGLWAPVSVSVKRSGGKTILGAFVARASSGKVAVMARVGKERLPIKELFGPAIPQMMGEPMVKERIMINAEERFTKRIDHEVAWLLEKGK